MLSPLLKRKLKSRFFLITMYLFLKSDIGFAIKSIGQLFSALCTAACENLATVLGSHSLHKSVLALSLKLLRLVSSFHFQKPPFVFRLNLREDIVCPHTTVNNNLLYMITKALSSVFCKFSSALRPFY